MGDGREVGEEGRLGKEEMVRGVSAHTHTT